MDSQPRHISDLIKLRFSGTKEGMLPSELEELEEKNKKIEAIYDDHEEYVRTELSSLWEEVYIIESIELLEFEPF